MIHADKITFTHRPEESFPLPGQAETMLNYHVRLNEGLQRKDLSPFVWPALLLFYSKGTASLREAAEVLCMPETSALRWIKSLQERGMLIRHQEDGLTFRISAAGREAVDLLFDSLN